jgi:hypothetical protein
MAITVSYAIMSPLHHCIRQYFLTTFSIICRKAERPAFLEDSTLSKPAQIVTGQSTCLPAKSLLMVPAVPPCFLRAGPYSGTTLKRTKKIVMHNAIRP